jgi:hypothetical protein
MKTLILAVIAASLAIGPAIAQTYYNQNGGWNSQQLGDFTYHNGTGSNQGWNGTSQQLGDFNYSHFNGPQGQQRNCTSQRLGNQTYTRCN